MIARLFMTKLVLFLFVSLVIWSKSFAQDTLYRALFIVDSIPLLIPPGDWDPLTQEDIADLTVITNKDSIRALGWEDVDGITYIFTKAYRSRPDSIKRIPSLKQMEMKNKTWYFHDTPYTGKYIDYFNKGKVHEQGILLNGKLDGESVIYFENGNKKTVSNYKDGVLHGTSSNYYPNGSLMGTRNYIDGKTTAYQKEYFTNGQVMHEIKQKKKTSYDTAFSYYSTGKLKLTRLIRNGVFIPDKKTRDFDYYSYQFYHSLDAGQLKEANKSFYKLWMIDSSNADIHFTEGLLMLKEFRYDDAIEDFDKALQVEPLMREAFAHRALARIKKFKYARVNVFLKNFRETYLTIEDISSAPENEQIKICNDLKQAQYLDFTDAYVQKIVPYPILIYCARKK